jgi:voltage-gated potassium channel
MQQIDNAIYVLFILDYFVRFAVADGKRIFIKQNILDLIAILPFNSALRIFRTFKALKILKLARLTKLLRAGSVMARMAGKTKLFFQTTGFQYVLFLTALLLAGSTLAMMFAENMSFSDALWWSFVTTTTVGYGDLSPVSGTGRFIASLLMIVGIGLISYLISCITGFFMSEQSGNKSEEKPDSVKVEMVLKLYRELNEEEQEEFQQIILPLEKLPK